MGYVNEYEGTAVRSSGGGVSFVQNGELTGGGGMAAALLTGEHGLMRPYMDDHDRLRVDVRRRGRYTTNRGQRVGVKEPWLVRDLVNSGEMAMPMVTNATALRKEEWVMLDTAVLRAARARLRAYNDIAAANTFGGFNGMAKMILEHETMTDPGEAIEDMDGLTDGRTDAPKFQLQGTPLPITHADYFFGARQMAISRNSGTPLDATMAEACARRIGERIEKVCIGVSTGVTYGGNSTQVGGYSRTSSVYGMTNFPDRLTKTNLTTPTGANPDATLSDVLSMRQQLYNNFFYGPFMLYHTNDWDPFMDDDYARAVVGATSIATSKTLRQRLRDIDGIIDVRRLDFFFSTQLNTAWPGTDVDVSLKPFSLLLVQLTTDVIRAVSGMDITTIQWETKGGMQINFKVMTIQATQIRSDAYGRCGLLHATTS